MSEHVDIAVVGAGVIGLAVARALAMAGREVLLLEQEPSIGTGISSRNSEVIHAGIYYPKDSLKARFCVAGKKLLYRYCEEHHIDFRRLRKLIVATSDSEVATLEGIRRHASDNGVDDLQFLNREQALALEPELDCEAALLSPSTGIIDSHAYMLSLLGEAQASGAAVAFLSPVQVCSVSGDRIVVDVGGKEPMRISCNWLVNAAGLSAVDLASGTEGFPRSKLPGSWLCKGSYFTLRGRAPFRHLIYPVPEHAGLGVHMTLDMGGQAKFGPDTEWIDRIDYNVDIKRAEKFYAAIRRYWPGLPDASLDPGYAGIRPKISGPKDAAADFRIDGPAEHGVSGLVNLFGIESPGLTASLAIAGEVQSIVTGSESSQPKYSAAAANRDTKAHA